MRKRLLSVVALLALLPTIESLGLYINTPPLILVAAMGPALFLCAVAFGASGPVRQHAGLLLGAFLCGALVAAFLSSALNDLVFVWIAAWAGGERSRALTPITAGPLVEEVVKALVLWLLFYLQPRRLGVRGGMALGGALGIGFAMTENVQYFILATLSGGTTGLGQAVYTRALLGGLNHAVFTACAGAGIGWALESVGSTARRAAVAGGALGLAIVQHVVWNAVASRSINDLLCNPAVVDGPCRGEPSVWSLAVVAPLVELVFVAPGVVLLVMALRSRQ